MIEVNGCKWWLVVLYHGTTYYNHKNIDLQHSPHLQHRHRVHTAAQGLFDTAFLYTGPGTEVQLLLIRDQNFPRPGGNMIPVRLHQTRASCYFIFWWKYMKKYEKIAKTLRPGRDIEALRWSAFAFLVWETPQCLPECAQFSPTKIWRICITRKQLTRGLTPKRACNNFGGARKAFTLGYMGQNDLPQEMDGSITIILFDAPNDQPVEDPVVPHCWAMPIGFSVKSWKSAEHKTFTGWAMFGVWPWSFVMGWDGMDVHLQNLSTHSTAMCLSNWIQSSCRPNAASSFFCSPCL